MMKVKLLTFIMLFFFVSTFSQTKPIYFDGNKVTNQPEKATAYGVYGKLSNQELWVLKKYDFDDNLLMSGTYKDELLIEPHGKFTFYGSVAGYNNENSTAFKNSNTDRYIVQKGAYDKGLEEGRWYSYFPDGIVMSYYSYAKGKLEGKISAFNTKGRMLFTGQYEEGLKVGTWYDVVNRFKDVYERDTLVSSKKLTRAEILSLK